MVWYSDLQGEEAMAYKGLALNAGPAALSLEFLIPTRHIYGSDHRCS